MKKLGNKKSKAAVGGMVNYALVLGAYLVLRLLTGS